MFQNRYAHDDDDDDDDADDDTTMLTLMQSLLYDNYAARRDIKTSPDVVG